MHNKTIAELSAGLKNGDFSSEELTRSFLARIEKLDPQVNSYISVTTDEALSQAREADKRIAAGNASALTGVPIAQKDIFCTNGVKTSSGSKMLDKFIAPYDATVVSKFNQAGAVMLGKTNMD
ncbi:MAG: Asp-tRNA(Asn)/Glu-tRNA(Gln) amidotransferase GatCAB subunit A, partial [Gammaproteobacteria bacterium]|nr:Asp-tRNA(Asn)/Glu-tRNA(Gln) amidotransferase GatCAB subunit A [Gammaproteobacteria bacterium]